MSSERFARPPRRPRPPRRRRRRDGRTSSSSYSSKSAGASSSSSTPSAASSSSIAPTSSTAAASSSLSSAATNCGAAATLASRAGASTAGSTSASVRGGSAPFPACSVRTGRLGAGSPVRRTARREPDLRALGSAGASGRCLGLRPGLGHCRGAGLRVPLHGGLGRSRCGRLGGRLDGASDRAGELSASGPADAAARPVPARGANGEPPTRPAPGRAARSWRAAEPACPTSSRRARPRAARAPRPAGVSTAASRPRAPRWAPLPDGGCGAPRVLGALLPEPRTPEPPASPRRPGSRRPGPRLRTPRRPPRPAPSVTGSATGSAVTGLRRDRARLGAASATSDAGSAGTSSAGSTFFRVRRFGAVCSGSAVGPPGRMMSSRLATPRTGALDGCRGGLGQHDVDRCGLLGAGSLDDNLRLDRLGLDASGADPAVTPSQSGPARSPARARRRPARPPRLGRARVGDETPRVARRRGRLAAVLGGRGGRHGGGAAGGHRLGLGRGSAGPDEPTTMGSTVAVETTDLVARRRGRLAGVVSAGASPPVVTWAFASGAS